MVHNLPIAFKLIVECKLFAFRHGFDGEDTDAKFCADDPFFQMTVRVARVINKPSEASPLGGINDFIRLERHEIKVLNTGQGVFPCTLDETSVRQDLSDVLHHKVTSITSSVSNQRRRIILDQYDPWIRVTEMARQGEHECKRTDLDFPSLGGRSLSFRF